MSAPSISYIQYFIPSDNDSEDHPNVFVVRKPPRNLTLGDVSSAFPLPGKYLFRAKSAYGKGHSAFAGRTALKRSRARAEHLTSIPLRLHSPPP